MIEYSLAKSIDDLFEHVVIEWGLSILNTSQWVIYNSFNREKNERSASSYCKIPGAFLKKMIMEEFFKKNPNSKINENRVSNLIQKRLDLHRDWALKLAKKPEYKHRLIKAKNKTLEKMDTDLAMYDIIVEQD
jgi:hypothetical protein